MSETTTANQHEKATKIRRKPERESVLTPTFAAERQVSNPTSQQGLSSGGSLLQRQCSCGKHTIGGSICETCQKQDETAVETQSDSLDHVT